MVIVLVGIIGVPGALCQTSFGLDKRDGHYFMSTTVNGVDDTEIFVETGFSALTLCEADYQRLLASSVIEALDLEPDKKLYMDHGVLDVVSAYDAKVRIGGLCYDGPVHVVKAYDKIAVPVHMLRNETDTAATLIRLDFKNKTMDYVRREAVDLDNLHLYNIVKYAPYPTFEATLQLSDTYGHSGEITGNWIFDLGSGTSIYFFRKCMARFIKENKFKVLRSKDKQGNAVGQGIFARYCKVGEQKAAGIPIGISNRLWFDYALGLVGPSFFNKGYVVIDPEKNKIYYK